MARSRGKSKPAGIPALELGAELERGLEASCLLIVGEEDFLRTEALAALRAASEASAQLTEFDGDRAALSAVLDELRTLSFFGGKRIAVVRKAGGKPGFASEHGEALAAWAEAKPKATLVLEGASPGLQTQEERDARIAADEKLAQMAEADLEAFVDHWGSISLWDSQKQTLSEPQRAALRQQRMAQRSIGLANSLRGMGTGSQTWLGDCLPRIGVPVLLTAGRLDTKYVQWAETMGAAIPDARVRIIEGGGHAAHLEQPQAFNSVVLEFLREMRDRA